MLKILCRLWGILAPRRKSQLIMLGAGMVIAGIFEMLSLGIFAPLIAALAAPAKVLESPLFLKIQEFAQEAGLELPATAGSNLAIFAVGFGVLAMLAGGTRIAVLWASSRFTGELSADISSQVFAECLNLEYKEHIKRGAGELISLVRDKSAQATSVIYYVLNLLTSISIALMICIGLLILHPLFTFCALSVLGAFYYITAWIVRKKIFTDSRVVAEESTQAMKTVQEGLGSIRDVILDGTENFFVSVFHNAESKVQKANNLGLFLSSAPRYFTDTFAMILIACLIVGWLYNNGDLSPSTANFLPALAVLALGAQRCMPLVQQVYTSWAVVSGRSVAVDMVLNHLGQKKIEPKNIKQKILNFEKNIKLCNLSFRYHPKHPWVVKNLTLEIRKGSRIGFIGKTGSGKSTILDIIMGLLEPIEGKILIDNELLTSTNVKSWQKNIAHVPQNIFLSDSSLAENIACGLPVEKIDMKKVRSAARQAQIADFIESSHNGYAARVGERGIRLSGGQKQRIAIARALYKNCKLLILDESTSALDEKTEENVLDSIINKNPNLTILMIAHRLSSLKHCSKIIEIQCLKRKYGKV